MAKVALRCRPCECLSPQPRASRLYLCGPTLSHSYLDHSAVSVALSVSVSVSFFRRLSLTRPPPPPAIEEGFSMGTDGDESLQLTTMERLPSEGFASARRLKCAPIRSQSVASAAGPPRAGRRAWQPSSSGRQFGDRPISAGNDRAARICKQRTVRTSGSSWDRRSRLSVLLGPSRTAEGNG